MKKSFVLLFVLLGGVYLASCNRENILADDSSASAASSARAAGSDTTGSDSTKRHKKHHSRSDSTKHFHSDSLKKHVRPDSTKGHSRPDSVKGSKLTKVEVSALPTAITGYITATYAGYEIKEAAKNEEGLYYVAIASTDTRRLLVFNADGTFKEEKTAGGGPGKPKKGKK